MVGIYCSKNLVRFSRPGKAGEIVSKEYQLGGEDVDQVTATVESIFKTAQKDFGFTAAEDFRLLIDFPLCQSVAQMVPFPESQLSQVLENYLEEELPNDIEDYAFDYQVLESKGANSSILAFWIKRTVLQEWTDLANEWSLNSLDVQPAEMAMVKDSLSDSCIQFQNDPLGRIRYCGLVQRNQLPHMTVGMFKETDAPENIKRILKFSFTDLSQVNRCIVHPEIANPEMFKEIIGCENIEMVETATYADCFMEYSLQPGKAKQLDYRKGEYSQKGIEEKVLIPAIILLIATLSCIAAFSWKNIKLVQAEDLRQEAMLKQKVDIWDTLFYEEKYPFPAKRIDRLQVSDMERLGGVVVSTNSNKKGTDHDFSALQTLGQLFEYIAQDKEVLITRATINKKSISLIGTTTEQERAYKLKELFKNQERFEVPDVKATKVTKTIKSEIEGAPPEKETHFKFTFKTSLIRNDE
jgi:hypothetical protein